MPCQPASTSLSASLPEVTAFGRRLEDLDLDFSGNARGEIAVKLVAELARATDHTIYDTDWATGLPLSARIYQLLRIVRASIAGEPLERTQTCLHADCRAAFDVALPLERLLQLGRDRLEQGETLDWPPRQGSTLRLRRATGRDQARWRSAQAAGHAAPAIAVLASLVVEGSESLETLDQSEYDLLSSAMREFDPLVAFRLDTRCPHCQRTLTLPIDLEALCLNRLELEQRQLFATIHTIAGHYHWNEHDILKLNPKRRAYYLRRIDAQETACV